MENICGIYSLSWGPKEQNLIYVGKSLNIYSRFKSHINKLKLGVHTNRLVQKTYSALNVDPICTVLEECDPENLNNLEIYWHLELDSITNGLNIAIPGQGSFGTDHNTAKYSKARILRVFSLLCKIPQESYDVISNKTGVHVGTISSIRGGKSHIWLKYAYPAKYKILENRAVVKTHSGLKNSNSKYSKKSILKCLSLLAKHPEMTQQAIADRVKVPRHLITAIRAGSHTWLKEEYPIEYSLAINKPNARNTCRAGTSNPNSKYTRKTILKCLCLLLKGKTNREIADRLSMDIAAVNKVRRKQQHKWLEKEFPDKYAMLPT